MSKPNDQEKFKQTNERVNSWWQKYGAYVQVFVLGWLVLLALSWM